jgi:hypothetical protein
MLTRYGTKKILRTTFFIFIGCIVLGYALFAMHDFLLGPSLTITEPQNGQTFTTPRVVITGIVYRIQDISLNGRSITIDNKGNFREVVLLAPGYNAFQFALKDKFGRSKDYRLEYTYEVN